jgi:hypothetical protein
MVYAIKILGEVGRENQKHEENKNSSNILISIKAIMEKKEKYRGYFVMWFSMYQSCSCSFNLCLKVNLERVLRVDSSISFQI